jgi:hypothetical protein
MDTYHKSGMEKMVLRIIEVEPGEMILFAVFLSCIIIIITII